MLSEDQKITEKSGPLVSGQGQNEAEEEIKDVIIHEMPERFRLFNQTVEKKSKYGMVLLLIVGVFVALLAAIAVYYFSNKTKPTTALNLSKNVTSEKKTEETEKTASPKEIYFRYNSDFLAIADLVGYENFLVNNASQERVSEWQAQKEKITALSDVAKINLLVALKKGILSQNDMKEVQENINGNESVLNIITTSDQRASVRMVMENGAWKLDKEYWPDAGSSNGLPFLVDTIATAATASSTAIAGDNLATTTPPNASSTEIQATSTPTAPTETQIQYNSGLDSDNDGLSDKEEAILGTDPSKPDSDGDGYQDSDELNGLYDPASKGKLTDNKNISLYKNLAKNYSVLYPTVWKVEKVDGDDSLIFMSADGQFFQIVAQANANKQTVEDWYKDQFNLTAINMNNLMTGSGWTGIKSDDGLNVYLTDSLLKNIYVLSYAPGTDKTIDYSRLFAIFVKTFTLGK